ncbi:MAG: zinc metalloprotease [Sphingobacteriales bacterium]|nr:zinc metalloprotease [Sphingobacteriales bacterium]MBI3720380.1 zinc metalloprotease [Sphingobacteriales bacterium]
MKKILSLVIAGTVIAIACNKADRLASPSQDAESLAAPTKRMCASMEVLQEQLKAYPTLQSRMDALEKTTQNFIKNKSLYRLSGDTMIIPVVVNVVYRAAQENISLGQIQSQIDVLNEDYGGTNADIAGLPGIFTGVKAGDTKIRFVLDQVIRKATTKKSWSTNDAVKKSSQGGISPTSPTTKLNMWACTLGNGLLGYAQFPGGSSATDGVVILNSAFGSRAKYPGGYYTTTYDLGRTATHEVGHWFNLRHIWGDATCGDDLVGDTPKHNTANYGCPVYPHYSTCTGTPVEMTMNYMDYTDDACMYMFSAGQATRMQATWIVGGPRASFR